MKKILAVFILLTCSLMLSAQTENIIRQLNQFSPLAEIIIRNLGMEDKNNNGVIDKGACEGYEEFIERYGIGVSFDEKERSIDCGFFANYILYGAGNGKLEEPEIVNYYYTKIRFNPVFEKEEKLIEEEINAYVYANNLPLIWLDDEQNTVMNEVTRILGAGWNEQKVTEDEAIRMYTRAVQGMRIIGRTERPNVNDGYYNMPEFVNRRAAYCVEVADFGFWFFSKLGINSVSADGALTSSVTHVVIKLNSGKIIDYFGGNSRNHIPQSNWHTLNPIQSMGLHLIVNGDALYNQEMMEQGLIYNKYDIDTFGRLMNFYYRLSPINYRQVICDMGEFFLLNNDINRILNNRHIRTPFKKSQIASILSMILVCSNLSANKPLFEKAEVYANRHFRDDRQVQRILREYRF